ncbi:aryl sulfotransferase [Branchiostoma belcheri]|nr:aryl sulfotransferase [Branchiostoma belcheri]
MSGDDGYLPTGLGIMVSFPGIVPAEGLKALTNFETRPDDVVIVSYPKSGLNWTYEVVTLILNNANITKHKVPLFTHVPYLESTDILDRETRWWERSVKEAIYERMYNPTLNREGGLRVDPSGTWDLVLPAPIARTDNT